MKINNLISVFCLSLMSVAFVACDDDEENESWTPTDCSSIAVGEYTGSAIADATGDMLADDVQVVVKRIEDPSVQAVSMKITSVKMNMDQDAIFNIGRAEDKYVFTSGTSSTTIGEAWRNSCGVLSDNVLTLSLSLNSKYKFSTASAAKNYTFVCSKK